MYKKLRNRNLNGNKFSGLSDRKTKIKAKRFDFKNKENKI